MYKRIVTAANFRTALALKGLRYDVTLLKGLRYDLENRSCATTSRAERPRRAVVGQAFQACRRRRCQESLSTAAGSMRDARQL